MDFKPLALVADDQKTNRTLLVLALESCGFQCVVAEDGLQVEEYITQQNFDILVLDNQMPGKSGYELARLARNVLRLTIPIAIWTADPQALPGDAALFADILSKGDVNILEVIPGWIRDKQAIGLLGQYQ